MTETDQIKFDAWQAQAADADFMAVRDLHDAVAALERLSLSRVGSKFIRGERQNIADINVRLFTLLANSQPTGVAP